MKNLLANLEVALVSSAGPYPVDPPFDPPEPYPEYPYSHFETPRTDTSNHVYRMVREALRLLALDDLHFGTPAWNPLGELITPGDRVLIKPNFVLHFNAGGGPLDAVVTHPSVIRAIVDYVVIALKRRGEILIGDAPQMNCDMARLFELSGMDSLTEFLGAACLEQGIKLCAADFRVEQTFYKYGIIWRRKSLDQRPSPIRVDLGEESWMNGIDSQLLYGADYCRRATVRAHSESRHEYLIAPDVLSSDVVISVPKLKVHRKVGVTLNLKNMVGINADKNHLAHYRVGSPSTGGDECSSPRWEDSFERLLSDSLLGTDWRLGRYPFAAWRGFRKIWDRIRKNGPRRPFSFGNWHGNDTAWRMALDLNRILLFADRQGRIGDQPARKYFSLIDGIVGGEGEGPLHPDARVTGVLLAGFNPVAVDWTATALMGFNPALIPLYANAVKQVKQWLPDFQLDGIGVRTNSSVIDNVLDMREPVFRFRAPAGWHGKIECYSVEDEHATGRSTSVLDAVSQ